LSDAEAHLRAPLAPFAGAEVPAPDWFRAAIGRLPERFSVTVDGAAIETLAWGDRGKPGLLLLHGNGAHADWWRFIAPFFAGDFRVAAISWSGMGGSDHRPHYRLQTFVDEAFAGAEAAGLFEAAEKPLVAAHSFGGFPLAAMAQAQGARLRGAIIVDSPASLPLGALSNRARPPVSERRAHRVYPTLAEALARFRFAPEQPCEHLFIADFIARAALKPVDGGWTWKFDPHLWSEFELGTPPDLAQAQCPVAVIWGDRSKLMPPDTRALLAELNIPHVPAVVVPDAAHHVMIDQPIAFVSVLRTLIETWAR
jgi:pimeloyl-ACP methyl ester carboxylesterase